jgi:hypothetical protein
MVTEHGQNRSKMTFLKGVVDDFSLIIVLI